MSHTDSYDEIITKDFSAVTPRDQIRDLLYQAMKAIEKQMHAKSLRMNRLIENNHVLPKLAQTEWDSLQRDLTDLSRDLEILSSITKHQI